MFKFERSIVIDAPVEQVFAYLLDPTHVPEYMQEIEEVRDIQRLPDGRSSCTLVSKFLGLRVEVRNEKVEVIPNERIVEKSQGEGLEYTGSTRFERLDGGKTRTSVADEVTIHGGPLGKLGEAFFAKRFVHGEEVAMQLAKERLEAAARATTIS